MKPSSNIKLVSAEYVSDYKYEFKFSNGVTQVTNFRFVMAYFCSGEYLDVIKFKKMKFKPNGFIYWGKNEDICFSIEGYYFEKIVRPPTKKQLARYSKMLSSF